MAHITHSDRFDPGPSVEASHSTSADGLSALYILAALLAIAIAIPAAIMTAQTAPL